MVPRVGQRIGPYEILGRLGTGGMGLVFSAWDARLQRDVAIKLLREEYATPTMRMRFLQEARAASGLNHPNICTIFDIGEVSGEPYLVMELLRGETLRARLTREGKLLPEDVCRVATEVVDALIVAHARGVIHRDIKPANIILVTRPGGGFQAKVLDFGLAKMEMGDENTHSDLTTIGTTVGTVSYMSPEQARGETIDARSDLFSLGAVLYEAATGELPFQGATSALIFVELLGKAPVAVRTLNPDVPKDLDKIITRLLAKTRSDRFQSASSVLAALQTVSFRKSPLASLSIWGKSNAGKQRTDAPLEADSNDIPDAEASPSPRVEDHALPPKSSPDLGSVLRPARRGYPEVPTPRISNSPVLPSPPVEAASPPKSLPSSVGEVILRPVKPESMRSADGRVHGSSGEAPVEALLPKEDGGPASRPETGGDSQPSAAVQLLPSPNGSIDLAAGNTTSHSMVQRVVLSRPTGPAQEEPFVSLPPLKRPKKVLTPAERRVRWLSAVIAFGLLAAGLTWYFTSRPDLTATAGPTTIVLAGVQNSTGDSALAGVFAAGLQLELIQSPHLNIRTGEQYQSGLHSAGHGSSGAVPMTQAREAAQAVGAQTLLFGDIHPEGAAYLLTLHIYDAVTGSRLTDLSETAASREQIADGLDRLASDLRSALGEASDSIGRNSVPLSKEATSNVDALGAFASGNSLEASGSLNEATVAFQQAVAFEPHFAQAHLHLAELYREQYAEVASAKAATESQADAATASARTQELAQASVAFHVAGDYGRGGEVLRRLLVTYPKDLDALNGLSFAQFRAGKFSDAEATAERVLKIFRFDRQAMTVQGLALIALGRPEAVASIEADAQAAAPNRRGIATLAVAASAGRNEMLLPDADQPLPPALAANLLEAAGHFSEGTAKWQSLVDAAHSQIEMLSAAAYAEGVSALNHALASDCDAALPLAQQVQGLPAGPVATFSAGEAQALCGKLDAARANLNTLSTGFVRGSAAQNYLVPDLSATISWKSGDTPAALQLLDAARQFDSVSLTAYLRGMVEIAAKQPQLGIIQFQAILSHRGQAMLFCPEVYPMAQLGLGRAYAASGDTANSSAAYAHFLELWNTADPGLGVITEARTHAH